jgi:hypothetical protein
MDVNNHFTRGATDPRIPSTISRARFEGIPLKEAQR